jgi:asparagine synthase (glutamine-hydrolysing)
VKVDRMSMQHSLEVRCPLLDRRVVEWAFRVPIGRKMPRLRAKYLLKSIGARRLPAELLTLPKHGFTAPIGAWLAGPYAGAFRDEVLGSDAAASATFDRARVQRLHAEHCAGKADHSYALWAVWCFEKWARRERAGASAHPAARPAVSMRPEASAT